MNCFTSDRIEYHHLDGSMWRFRSSRVLSTPPCPCAPVVISPWSLRPPQPCTCVMISWTSWSRGLLSFIHGRKGSIRLVAFNASRYDPDAFLCNGRENVFKDSMRSSSVALSTQSRENRSAAVFNTPAICSTSKLYCCISHFHRSTFGDASLLRYRRFLWSVLIVNGISLNRYDFF